jgi:hypothetical protein
MASFGDNFDARTTPPKTEFEVLPARDYLAIITASEMKDTSKGGTYLLFTFEVIEEGAYKGRKVFARVTRRNDNQQAMEIGNRELSAIIHATNLDARDTVELHNIPLIISVKCRKREDNGEMTNEIRNYKRQDGAKPATTSQQAPGSLPPWQRAA